MFWYSPPFSRIPRSAVCLRIRICCKFIFYLICLRSKLPVEVWDQRRWFCLMSALTHNVCWLSSVYKLAVGGWHFPLAPLHSELLISAREADRYGSDRSCCVNNSWQDYCQNEEIQPQRDPASLSLLGTRGKKKKRFPNMIKSIQDLQYLKWI